MPAPSERLAYLDAVRAFALMLGVLFHTAFSFQSIPVGWAVMDISTTSFLQGFITVSHSFRMEIFFLIAGFFSHMTFHRKGVGAFIKSRALRIVVPFVLFWIVMRPLVVSGWIMGFASMRGELNIAEGLLGGLYSLLSPRDILVGTHLWFLYYLVLVTTGWLALRGLVQLSPSLHTLVVRWADHLLRYVASSPWGLWCFIVPSALVLWYMSGWGMDTPDRSLLPHIPVSLLYGGCFGCGWLLHRQPHLIAPLTRINVWRVALAALSIAVCWQLIDVQTDVSHPRGEEMRAIFTIAYAVMMWSLVFLTIGVFRKFFDRPSPRVRYLADASYWMYLFHLPVVLWLQIAVAEWPLPWWVKLPGITLATVALSLVTYDLLVRSTGLGWLLNGRRRERSLFKSRHSA